MKCWTRKFYDSKVQWNRCTLLNAAINRDYITVHAVFVTFCTCWSSPSSNHIHLLEQLLPISPSFKFTHFFNQQQKRTYQRKRPLIHNPQIHHRSTPITIRRSTVTNLWLLLSFLNFCSFPWKDSESIDLRSRYVRNGIFLALFVLFYFVCLCDFFFTERSNQQRSWERTIENKLTSNCSLFLVHALSFIFSQRSKPNSQSPVQVRSKAN